MRIRSIILILSALLFAGCANGADAIVAMDAVAPVFEAAGAEPATDGAAPAVYSNIVVAVRRNGETVSERAVTGEKNAEKAQWIIFDYMVKSAAWEGVETNTLRDCIVLSFDSTEDAKRRCYYQYDAEGNHVLQAGERGMYTVMSGGAYDALLQLAGLAPETAISVEEATALLREKFGERDAATGNAFSFGYVGRVTDGATEYFRFRISWLVDNDHLSYLTDYLVSADGSEQKEYLPEETDAP